MAKILILRAPHGDQPEWVREAWRGLKLRTYNVVCNPVSNSGKKYEGAHYCVNAPYAVRILKKRNPKAAQWFKENGDISSSSKLLFPTFCAKLL